MSDVPELVVTEGRAYHRGDVVILRMKLHPSPDQMERARRYLAPFTEKTGVEFLVLDDSVEVVEPGTPLDMSKGTR